MPVAAIPHRPKLTHADYELFPEDGQRHEIIDGEHFVTPAPNPHHQRIHRRIFLALGVFLEEHGLGELFSAPLDVVLSDFDIVQPDLVFFSTERLALLTERHAEGAPDLVVEVLSPSTRRRDERMKRNLYEQAGVREYWIVDPELETVKVYTLRDGLFAAAVELAMEAGDVLATDLLPGFELSLAKLFAS